MQQDIYFVSITRITVKEIFVRNATCLSVAHLMIIISYAGGSTCVILGQEREIQDSLGICDNKSLVVDFPFPLPLPLSTLIPTFKVVCYCHLPIAVALDSYSSVFHKSHGKLFVEFYTYNVCSISIPNLNQISLVVVKIFTHINDCLFVLKSHSNKATNRSINRYIFYMGYLLPIIFQSI